MRIGRLSFVLGLTFIACGGSGTRDATAQDPEVLIDDACNRIVSLQCPDSFSLSECHQELHQERADAAKDGCEAQFDALLVCIAERASECNQLTKEVCGPQVEALTTCQSPGGGEQCSRGMGGAPPGAPPGYQKCDINCPTWGVSCETDASSALICWCTGPKAGATFSPESCTTLTSSEAEQQCGGT